MVHRSFIFLSFILTILTMTMANPCPCELIVNESSSNKPQNYIIDPTINDLINEKFLEDYLDRSAITSQPETPLLYPLLRQTKSLDVTHQRNKRPSWAAVGKRATPLDRRPSWAQIG